MGSHRRGGSLSTSLKKVQGRKMVRNFDT